MFICVLILCSKHTCTHTQSYTVSRLKVGASGRSSGASRDLVAMPAIHLEGDPIVFVDVFGLVPLEKVCLDWMTAQRAAA